MIFLEMLVETFKISFICLHHGINPFAKIGKNEEKLKTRLTQKEKQWFIDSFTGNIKTYFMDLFRELR